ncbi:MAG TPA: radical SAM protein [Myxococcota bacterium]|nr:radical SAM protein [Myxococcota bacterium]
MPEAVIVQPPLLLSREFIDYPYFSNLGAYQAASILRSCGFEVAVVDGLLGEGGLRETGKQAWLGEPADSFMEKLAGIRADLVIVHASSFLRSAPGKNWLVELMNGFQAAGHDLLVLAEMVTGGMHYVESDPRDWLNDIPGLDLYLRYEGDRLLARLAGEYTDGLKPEREIWEERLSFSLDELPAPAYDLLDHESYFASLRRALKAPWRPGPIPAEPLRTLPIVTARGCPYGCVFCSSGPGLEGGDSRRYRPVPWPRVESWIRGWVGKFELERIVVLDDVANLDRRRFCALLDMLESLELRVEFPNGLRADRLAEDDIRRLAGLTSGLKVSLESASVRVQNEVLGKRLDPQSVERVAEWCKRYELDLQVHCLVGIPGEIRSEIVHTLQTARRFLETYAARPLVQFAVPLPGTELDKICREKKFVQDRPEDWQACFQHVPIIHTAEFDPRFLEQAVGAFRLAIAPGALRKVIVNLTYLCNNHCIFCAVGDRVRRHAGTGDVIEALRRYRSEGFELLDIDGGEPTLHPGLFEVIAQGRALGFERITLVTNGRRLSYHAYADTLARSGVNEVLVSLHAPDASGQARITGVTESFDQTLAGIRNILKCLASTDRVAVNTTLVADNLISVPQLGRLLSDLGVRRWNLQVVTPFGRAESAQLPREEDLRTILGGLLDEPPGRMHIQIVNCPPCLIPGHEEAAAMDFGKSSRDMVFVGEEGENLQAFLANRRRQDERCLGCAWATCCPGFYVFDERD